MKEGKSPFTNEWEKVIIHHMAQNAFGPFVEVTKTTHKSCFHNQYGSGQSNPSNPKLSRNLIQLGRRIGRLMRNNLSKLISDCDQVRKRKKVSFHCAPEESLIKVSETLGVILPEDFKELSLKVSHAGSPLIDFFLMYKEQDNPNGIIMNNLDLREEFAKYSNSKSDMSHILVLADDDGGSVFMITQDSLEKPTSIIWCDYGELLLDTQKISVSVR